MGAEGVHGILLHNEGMAPRVEVDKERHKQRTELTLAKPPECSKQTGKIRRLCREHEVGLRIVRS